MLTKLSLRHLTTKAVSGAKTPANLHDRHVSGPLTD